MNRMAAGLDFLFRYHNEGEELFGRIVTGGEKWVHHFTPEMKSASRQWVGEGDPRPVKAKRERSARKVNLTAFWDSEGILLQEYSTSTTNQHTYHDTLLRLRKAIQTKRPGKLSRTVVLLHNNATPHKARKIQDLLRSFKWDVFPHPAHSPDLAPSDFHLFAHLHRWLGGRRFATNDDVSAGVREYFASLDAQFYASGISKLLYRYEKCLARQGDYVEK